MAGYKDLLVYRLAVTIFDLTGTFCDRYISKKSRTYDQMVQAARSGKQNIAEASKELSATSTELAEDYEDFLRQGGRPVWDKDDPRALKIRAFREAVDAPTNLSNLSNWTNLDFKNPENFANLMVCLCYKEGYLMDQFLRSKQEKFIRKGGLRENLFKKRREYLKKPNLGP